MLFSLLALKAVRACACVCEGVSLSVIIRSEV